MLGAATAVRVGRPVATNGFLFGLRGACVGLVFAGTRELLLRGRGTRPVSRGAVGMCAGAATGALCAPLVLDASPRSVALCALGGTLAGAGAVLVADRVDHARRERAIARDYPELHRVLVDADAGWSFRDLLWWWPDWAPIYHNDSPRGRLDAAVLALEAESSALVEEEATLRATLHSMGVEDEPGDVFDAA